MTVGWCWILLLSFVSASLAADALLEADVTIVGAGYAGIITARRLISQGKKVIILEALNRSGGRAYDQVIKGKSNISEARSIEDGVAFIGEKNETPFANDLIVRELGMDVYDFPVWGPVKFGNHTADLLCRTASGKIGRFSNLFPDIITNKCVGDPIAIASLLEVTAELIAMSKELNVTEPWSHPKAQIWDSITLKEWLSQRMDEEGLNYMKITIEPDICQDIGAVSLLHTLFLCATGGGVFDGLYGFNNGLRIQGGGSAPVKKMVGELPSAILHLGKLVVSINQNASEVLTTCADGTKVRSKKVVLTGVPSVTSRINFSPPLPSQKRQALEQMQPGNVVRMSAIYDKPFWREMNLSGSYGDLDPNTMLGLGYDMTPSDPTRDGYDESIAPGVIQVETAGMATQVLMSMTPEARKKQFTDNLVKFFGPQAGTDSIDFLSFDFNSVPTLGGGKSHYPPGMWSQLGKWLRTPFMHVHWAGTEYSDVGFGYVEGAARSANHTAAILLDLLR